MPREMEASVQMKLYTLTKRHLALVFIAFLVGFFTSVFVGLAGPQVIYTRSEIKPIVKGDMYSTLSFPLETSLPSLTSFNQQLWLVAEPVPAANNSNDVLEGEITTDINLFYTDHEVYEKSLTEGKKHRNHSRRIVCQSKRCKAIILLHLGYIDKESYQVNVNINGLENIGRFTNIKFEFKTYKSSFTQLELWLRVVFLALTFVVTILFSRSMRPYRWRDWSIEQRWMILLLPLLLLYNNPLFALAFLVSSCAPYVIDGIFQATFLCCLLLFWLCIYHSLRQTKRKFCTFYLPKIVIVSLIWLSAVVLSTWQAINERDDPTYNYRLDTVNFMGFKIFLFIIASLYTLLLLYFLVRAFIELRNVAYFDLRVKFTTVYIGVVFSVSLAILVVRFGTGILDENFVSDISTRYGSSAEFLSFYGLLNFYVYTMAFVYSPSKNAFAESRLHDNPTISMLNESEDEDVMYGSEKEDSFRPVKHFPKSLAVDSD